MSERSLRLLISVLVVAGIFVYFLSESMTSTLPVKSKDEGLLGGPIAGLTRWQLAKFEEGKALFCKEFSVAEGLGPLYNASSCRQCHGGTGTAGGAGMDLKETSVLLFAKRKADGRLAKEPLKAILSKTESSDLDYFIGSGGPILIRHSINELSQSQNPEPEALGKDCKLEAGKEAPKDAEFRSRRACPPLFGLGLVDSVSEQVFEWQKARLAPEQKAFAGKAARVNSALTQTEAVGRFGAKAQVPRLILACSQESAWQMGLSNEIYRHTLSTKGPDKIPDCMKALCPNEPNLDSLSIAKIHFYLSTLAPPPRGAITAESMKGEGSFNKLGCAACHIKQLRSPEKVTLPNPEIPWSFSEQSPPSELMQPVLSPTKSPTFVEIRALEDRIFCPFSDFLVHDMGPALADGLAQPGTTGSEWRTTPLWGLRHKRNFLHDGRAKTIEEAIKMHGGQSEQAAKAYAKLSEEEKKTLMAFLNSL